MPKKKTQTDIFESGKTDSFDVKKLKDGAYIKRYYKVIKGQNGESEKVYTNVSERMGAVEKFRYQNKHGICKKRNGCLKMLVVTSVALGLAVGSLVFALNMKNDQKNDNNMKMEYGTTQRVEKQESEEKEPKVPVPVTYEQNGQTFISLDSSIEIAKYNYYYLQKELHAFNKTASSKYNFNPNLFDYATFVGLQIKESSLKLNDPNDTKCKGGFKLGADAVKEANEVSLALTGKKIIENDADLNDPIKSSKACMYFFVKNYEYLHDEIEKKSLNAQLSSQMVIDEYLYGCGNIFKELNGSGYTQKTYSKIILDYADIIRPFAEFLENEDLTKEEKDKERRSTFNKLYQIPEKYAEIQK